MKFKTDENLPMEMADLLRAADHDATTVVDQELRGEDDIRIIEACLQEGRALVTLDLDLADVRTYPPQRFPGLMVLRVRRQDKRHLLAVFRRVIPLIAREPVRHHLWIIEEARVRIRGEEG